VRSWSWAVATLGAGGLLGVTAWILGASSGTSELFVLGAAVAAGELVELRPLNRTPLPLAFAVMTVIVAADPWQVIVAIIVAEGISSALKADIAGLGSRLMHFAERCAEAFSAGAVFQVVIALRPGNAQAVELTAFTFAALAPIVVSDLVVYVRDRTIAPLRARGADVAVITSGILMAVGYEGIDGRGQLGLWGPILFSIPLIAAWYSFELLASTRRSFEQTVEALAAAPELGGLVREGHAERVAKLSVAMGKVLSLSAADLDHLRTAALLHHLGAVCLDEPEDGAPLDPVEVAAAGAAMLRASEVLAPAGDVVAAEPLLHRPPGTYEQPPAALHGMILKVASAYDELTEGDDAHASWAVEALYTGPGYVYDGRVLAALERVLEDRGSLSVR
jgi:hypothetical protein